MIRNVATAWTLLEHALDKHPLLVIRAAERILTFRVPRWPTTGTSTTPNRPLTAADRTLSRMHPALCAAGVFPTPPGEDRDALLRRAATLYKAHTPAELLKMVRR